jgi:hypothetical protein
MKNDKNWFLRTKFKIHALNFWLIDLLRATYLNDLKNDFTYQEYIYYLEIVVETSDDSFKPGISVEITFLDYFLLEHVDMLSDFV